MAQMKNGTTSSPTKKAPRTLAGTVPLAADSERAQTLALYEVAVRLMQEGKYEKAHAAFDKMLASSPADLADRIRMYINACLLQVSKGKATFLSHEERYDYAVSLLNDGHYEDAREQFKAILKENDKADYAFYGLAVLASMTGDRDPASRPHRDSCRRKSKPHRCRRQTSPGSGSCQRQARASVRR